MNKKQCSVCGFDKIVHEHHIIKRNNYGSDEVDNLVFLCPNHHWIVDFGDEEDKLWILEEIKKITGKVGKELPSDKKDKLIKKARRLVEESLGGRYSDEEWNKKDMESSFNFTETVKWLRGVAYYGVFSRRMNKRAELLLLRDLIEEELKNA